MKLSPHNPGKFWLPSNICPMNKMIKNDSTVYHNAIHNFLTQFFSKYMKAM